MSGTVENEKKPGSADSAAALGDEKKSPLIMSFEERGIGDVTEVLNATEKDLAEANEIAGTFTL